MPVYCYKCNSCEKPFELALPLKECRVPQKCPECDSADTQKVITRVNFNLVGDNWPSKSYRIKEYGVKRREVMMKRMESKIREEPIATLVPNVGGEVFDTWKEAKSYAGCEGKDTLTYKEMVDKESNK